MLGRLALFSLLVASLLISAIAGRPAAAQIIDLDAASTTAWQLSVLESQSDWNALYDQMHPDAQLTVGRDTVAYWYRTYFAVNGPHPATVTGARLIAWTWPVTGRTYPITAEISYTQAFDNGTTVSEIVRLVPATDGSWRWFFGRSLEFVQQMTQEAWHYGDTRSAPERAGVPPSDLFAESLAAIEKVQPACFIKAGIAALPNAIGRDATGTQRSESGAQTQSISYLRPNVYDFPDLIAIARTLAPGESPESWVEQIRASQTDWNGPPYSAPPRGLVVDLAPESAYLAFYYEESNEAAGWVPVFMWGPRGSNALFVVVGPAIGLINELVPAWSQNARASCAG